MEHLGPELVVALAQTFYNLFTIFPSDRVHFVRSTFADQSRFSFDKRPNFSKLWWIYEPQRACVCGVSVTLWKQNKIQVSKRLYLLTWNYWTRVFLSRLVAIKCVFQDQWSKTYQIFFLSKNSNTRARSVLKLKKDNPIRILLKIL